MQILIDCHGLEGNKTGKAFYTYNLLYGLSTLSRLEQHDVVLFSPHKVHLGFKLPDNIVWKETGSKGMRFQLDLLRELRVGKHDVFFSPTSFIPSAWGGGKIVSIIYDFAVFQSGQFGKDTKAEFIEKLLIGLVVSKSAHIITISEYMQQELTERFPQAAHKSSVILGSPRPFSPQQFSEEILQRSSLEKENYLLFVGTLEPRKNLLRTLKAYKQCVQKFDKQSIPPLVLAGKRGWGANEVYALISELNLENYVRVLGYVNDSELATLYAYCSFLVYVPLYEGFGLPVLEALSYGKTCVTSTSTSLPEVVGPCGMTVDPLKEEEIARAIHQLYWNDKMREQFQHKTQDWVAQFSAIDNAEKLLDILERVGKKSILREIT